MRHLETAQVTEGDRRRLAAWNSTQREYPEACCLPRLVAAQSALTPDAVAIAAEDRTMSYDELNRRANQLAHHLRGLGIRPNDVVGCCVERSLDLVVVLLGILKADAAYLPLDPAYPSARLAFMLQDARASVVVAHQRMVPRLSGPDVRVVCLDGNEEALLAQSTGDPVSTVQGSDLAYVIYTSGSTGQPKGVEISHKNLLNLTFWHRSAFALTQSDRATQVTSPAFDATGWELWPYLTVGASVHFPDEDTRATPSLLRDWLVSQRISITFLPTPLAESVMTEEWPRTTALRFLLTGADTLHRYPSPELPFAVVNNYGPTETTVVATSGLVPPLSDIHSPLPPSIGRPIANTQIHILDKDLQELPIGEVGEMYIGGGGVGRGYVNRPDLSAERFIADPFSTQPSSWLYRTGDLARYMPDGQIAFVGRADHQIKIRGHRIEPAEIEHLLNRHPAIHTNVVMSRESPAGERQLVAYLVTRPAGHVTAGSLRDTLKAELPEYMVPSAFVLLESWPLTQNGKIDRAALPAPEAANMLRDEAVIEPATPAEKRMAGIVASLLAVERMGIDDNFFLIGGNSLMGTQLIVRAAEVFGVDIPLRRLFEMPTVRQLAAEVERLIVAKVEAMSEDEALRLLQ